MNLHRIDLVSLSLFNLVARTGSISQGAELAMLAVGAASKRISDLETAFGVQGIGGEVRSLIDEGTRRGWIA